MAVVYHHTAISFYETTRLLILWFLLLAHVSLYFVFQSCLRIEAGRSVVWFLPLVIIYGEVIHWALDGFYDPLAFTPMLLCARYLDERRGLAAVIAFCAATSIHFRALLMTPWALYAAWIIVRDRQWRTWRWPHFAGLAVAAGLAAATLYPFALLWPVLRELKSNNVLGLGLPVVNVGGIAALLTVVGTCALALAWARAWVDVAMLAWLTLFFLTVREAYAWHILLALPWLAAPVWSAEPSRAGTARDARFAALLFIAVQISDNPLVPTWTRHLFS